MRGTTNGELPLSDAEIRATYAGARWDAFETWRPDIDRIRQGAASTPEHTEYLPIFESLMREMLDHDDAALTAEDFTFAAAADPKNATRRQAAVSPWFTVEAADAPAAEPAAPPTAPTTASLKSSANDTYDGYGATDLRGVIPVQDTGGRHALRTPRPGGPLPDVVQERPGVFAVASHLVLESSLPDSGDQTPLSVREAPTERFSPLPGPATTAHFLGTTATSLLARPLLS